MGSTQGILVVDTTDVSATCARSAVAGRYHWRLLQRYTIIRYARAYLSAQ